MLLARLTTRWRCPIPGKPDSVFGLRIYRDNADYVAILTERPDNPGPSLANEPVAVGGVLWEALDQPTSFRLFEHTPPRATATEPYDQIDQYTAVATVVRERRLQFSGFQHIEARELERIVGQPLVWFPVARAFDAALRAAGFAAAAAGQPGFHIRRPDFSYTLDARIEHHDADGLAVDGEPLRRYHDTLRAAGFDAWILDEGRVLRCRWLANARVPGRFSDPDEERVWNAVLYELAQEAHAEAGPPRIDAETISAVLDLNEEIADLAEADPALRALVEAIDRRVIDEPPVRLEVRHRGRAAFNEALAYARRAVIP